MYGRSGEVGTEDLSFLVGSHLTQIGLGKYDLGLSFGLPSTGIMIQSSFAFRLAGQESGKQNVSMGHHLRPFLNRDVIAASWAEQGTLILTFEGGDQIQIFDDSDQYESFTIGHGGKTIVI
jgi:hypothetical protein